jgi:hypothetical protein
MIIPYSLVFIYIVYCLFNISLSFNHQKRLIVFSFLPKYHVMKRSKSMKAVQFAKKKNIKANASMNRNLDKSYCLRRKALKRTV